MLKNEILRLTAQNDITTQSLDPASSQIYSEFRLSTEGRKLSDSIAEVTTLRQGMTFSPSASLEWACPVVILSEAKNPAFQKPRPFVVGALEGPALRPPGAFFMSLQKGSWC
jgi:hypothetical protein